MKHLASLAAFLPLILFATPAGAQQQILTLTETDTWRPGALHDDGRYAMMVPQTVPQYRDVLVREESQQWAPGLSFEDGRYVRYHVERRPQVDSTDAVFK